MTAKQNLGFKIWTAFLSVFVAVMLFPNIVGRRGVWASLLITVLAVGAIWLMYFAISRFIEWEVSKELKRKSRGTARREHGRRRNEPPDGRCLWKLLLGSSSGRPIRRLRDRLAASAVRIRSAAIPERPERKSSA